MSAERCQVYLCIDVAIARVDMQGESRFVCANHVRGSRHSIGRIYAQTTGKRPVIVVLGTCGPRPYDNSVQLWRFWCSR